MVIVHIQGTGDAWSDLHQPALFLVCRIQPGFDDLSCALLFWRRSLGFFLDAGGSDP